MDKLKTRVLIISLIILALLSVSAVAAADGVSDDDVISANQEDFDLSEETTDVEQVSANAQEDLDLPNEEAVSDSDDVLRADEEPGNFTELRGLITATEAGNTLTLKKDFQRVGSEAVISISKEITIDGQGKTIDASILNGIFSCSAPVKLMNINFINSNKTGAVTLSAGAVGSIIQNCTFVNCTSASQGAAITIRGNDIEVTDCRFENCTTVSGGAIFSSGNSTVVTGSNFTGNNASSGAGIYSTGNDLNVAACIFTSNNASIQGAGVYSKGNRSSISASNFTDNMAAYGAVYSSGDSSIINACNFTGNKAEYEGGAVYLTGNNSNITYSTFSKNSGNGTSSGGGAIWTSGQNTYFANSTFEENSHNFEAGAIFLDKKAIASIIDNCTFIGNTANGTSYGGGAIKCEANDSVVKDSAFEGNEAYLGGAIHWQADNGLISGSNFTDNSAKAAGGAISGGSRYQSFNNLTITACNFTGNEAEGQGGAINLMGNTGHPSENVTISYSFFSKNIAPNSEGGAIYSQAEGTTKVDNCTFVENEAINGGALCVRTDDGPINICDSKFYNNSVTSEGGAIYMDSPNILVDSCDFTNNTAGEIGGAISIDREGPKNANKNITIAQSNFTENEVIAGDGGAIYSEASLFAVDHCEFLENTASDSGGAVFHNDPSGSTNSFTDSKFINNTAKGIAGALYVYANNSEVKNSEFSGNDAANGGAAYIQGTNNVIDTVTFSNNTASRYSGAAYIAGYDNNIINSKFNDNSAGLSGGASLITGNNNAISNSEFNNNTASENGGALMHYSGNLDVDNSNFTENKAVNGSAIYQEKGALTVSNSKLFDNQAHSDSLTLTADVNIFDANVTTDYRGNDNLLNGIYTKNNDVTLTNVEYWGYADEMTTGSNVKPKDSADESEEGALVYNDIREAGINLTLIVYAEGDEENPLINMTSETGIFGNITGELLKLKPGTYKAYAVHEEDKYYTYIKSETIEFEIIKQNSTISADDQTVVYPNDVVLEADGENATGIDPESVVVTDADGNPVENAIVSVDGFKITISGLIPGEYTVTYTNTVDDIYYNNATNSTKVTVKKIVALVCVDRVVNYTGAVVTVIANVTDIDGHPIDGGFATYIIHYENKLSSGLLMASSEYYTAEVNDGKAVFKDITLGAPGTYPSTIEYGGNEYYTSAENESEVEVLPLNTTTSGKDVSGTAGEKKDITADIVDQNGNPVKNGTAVLTVNGKKYTAEVKDGKATFKDVELPSKSTPATIEYLGNDYYNPSNTTIQITVKDNPTPGPVPDDNKTTPGPSTKNHISLATPVAANPIVLAVIAVLSLVSTVSLGRKK